MSDEAAQKIPTGWHKVRFGGVARNVKVKVDRRDCKLDRYVAGEHMRTKDLRITEWGTIGEDYLGPAFNQKFVKGQILYGSRRTYLRKVALADFDGICANTTFVIEPKGIDLMPELLPFIMQSDAFTEHSIKMSKGSVNPYINWKDIACYEFTVPPAERQFKIARIIQGAENCLQRHEHLQDEAEVLKRVLAKRLFTKGINHKQFIDTEIGAFPRTWKAVRLEEVLELCQYGLSAKISDKGTYPIVKMDDLVNGVVVPDKIRYVDLDHTSFENFRLEKRDILFNRTNSLELVGRTGIFLLDGDYVFASYLIRLRPKKESIDPSYLVHYLIFSNDRLKPLATRAVSQANINATNLKNLKIQLPPILEQKEIARILSTLDSAISKIRQQIQITKALKMKLITELFTKGRNT